MTRIIIVTDSLSNSIAQSQIIEPLKRYHTQHKDQACIIISFERSYNPVLAQKIQAQIPFAKLIIYTRLPFFSTHLLYYAQHKLRTLLQAYNNYHIIARGPLSGFLALKSATNTCSHITIQARSLLAEEYRFAHPYKAWYHPRTWFDWLRARQLSALECYVYSLQAHATQSITIQAVSHAIAHYLQRTYQTSTSTLTLAQEDIPARINLNQVVDWRIQTRHILGIDQQATVYCFNGSIKPWQSPDMTITFFKQKLAEDPTSILLVLTQDSVLFKQQLDAYKIPEVSYQVINCDHALIYQYLSAADFGIIFRQAHIINWTSRPTKVLEYQAVGLPIIHNNTIAMLVEKECCSPK